MKRKLDRSLMRVSIYGVWIDTFKLLSIDTLTYTFIDMYSNDPLENTVMAPERNIFSIDDIADEYARLMDASKEAMRVDKEEDGADGRPLLSCSCSAYCDLARKFAIARRWCYA